MPVTAIVIDYHAGVNAKGHQSGFISTRYYPDVEPGSVS